MALLILALLQRIFLMSSLMLLLVWLIFFMVLIKLLPILGDRKSGSAGMPRPISYAVFCLKKKTRSDQACPQVLFAGHEIKCAGVRRVGVHNVPQLLFWCFVLGFSHVIHCVSFDLL